MKKLFLGYEYGTLFVNNRGFSNSASVDRGFSKKCELSKPNIESMLNNLSKEYSSRKFQLGTNIDQFYDVIKDYIFKTKTITDSKGNSFETGLYFKKASLSQRLYTHPKSIDGEWLIGIYTSSRPSKDESPLVFSPVSSLNEVTYSDFFSLITDLASLKPYSERNIQLLTSGYADDFLDRLNSDLKSNNYSIEILPPRFG